MTARILPGSTVRYLDHDCEVLSIVGGPCAPKVNLQCGRDRLADVPADLLTIVSPPPAIPKLRLEGLR